MSYQDWMTHLKVGDVLRDRKGNLRVVRKVTRYKSAYNLSKRKPGDVRCVSLAIRRCSWTGRCYTVLGYNELYFRGFQPAGLRARMTTALDARINAAIQSNSLDVTCQEAKGIL